MMLPRTKEGFILFQDKKPPSRLPILLEDHDGQWSPSSSILFNPDKSEAISVDVIVPAWNIASEAYK